MKKRMFSFCIAVVLTGAFLLSGCGKKVQASDLMKGVKANDVSKEAVLRDEDTVAAADFAVRLFEASRQENSEVLISPVSVLYALAMTANGRTYIRKMKLWRMFLQRKTEVSKLQS